jgi:hypothetical protein
MRTLLITLLLVGFGMNLQAQIRQIEYGWDTDKGHGLNTLVSVTSAGTDADVNLNVPMQGLSNGYHLLYVRTRDARGLWSHTYLRLVNVLAGSVPAKIVKVDYVYSQAGKQVGQYAHKLSNPTTSVQVTVPGDVSQLVAGLSYILSIWATDENGTQSQVYQRTFTYRVVDCKGLAVTVQGATALCTGSSTVLTAAVSGGNAPASIVWTHAGAEAGKGTSLTVSQAGSYVAQATDAQGCVVSATQSVIESPGLPVTVTGSSTFCAGTSTNLTANVSGGTTPFVFQWKLGTANVGTNSNSYGATAAGSYAVEVADSKGCKGTSVSVAVTQRPAPATPTLTASVSAIVTGGTATLQATIGTGLSAQWLLNDAPITGATQTSYTSTQGGRYTIRVTNSDGCSATSQAVTINLITAIDEPQSGPDFQISASPNPSQGMIEIHLMGQRGKTISVTLMIRDLTGRSLYQKQIRVNGKHTEHLDLTQQSAGLYLLNAATDQQQTNLRLIRQ